MTETEFLNMDEKVKIFSSLKNGNEQAIQFLFEEITRLENRIKELELVFEVIHTKLQSTTSTKKKVLFT